MSGVDRTRLDRRALGLADTHRLDDHFVETVLIHRFEQLVQIVGESVGLRARSERADVKILRAGEIVHPDPVTQDRAAGLRARRIDRQDAEPAAIDARQRKPARERALAGAGRAGDTDPPRLRRRRAYAERCGCGAARFRTGRHTRCAGVRNSRQSKPERPPVERRASCVNRGRRRITH